MVTGYTAFVVLYIKESLFFAYVLFSFFLTFLRVCRYFKFYKAQAILLLYLQPVIFIFINRLGILDVINCS